MNRKIAPPIKDAIEFDLKLKQYDYYEMDNGIPVYIIDAGAQDVLQLELIFFAGNSFEEKKGVAAAVNSLLKNGTRSRSAFQINEDFEYYGAYSSRACYNETATITLHTLSRHLAKLLPVIKDMITESVFPGNELDIYKQNNTQKLKVNLQKGEFVAARLIDSYLYGAKHPYGKYTEFSDLDELEVDTIRQFYDQYYVNGKCMIMISGKIPADARTLLNKEFGKLPLGRPTFLAPDIKTSPAVEKKYHIQNDPSSVQGAIRIASHFPNRHHPDFKKAVILNNVLGGYFGSRLMSNIREDKGYTYGIYSYLQNHIQQSAWLISTEAGKDVCEPTIEEIYKEMRKLCVELVPETELLLVRNYMIGSILGDLDGPFQIMAKWKNLILNQLDESFFYDSINEIKKITGEQLLEIAGKYLNPDKFYELVVY